MKHLVWTRIGWAIGSLWLGGLATTAAIAQDVPAYSSEVVPFMSKPFSGEYPTAGVYDHDPKGTGEQRQMTSWGSVTWGKSGHDGWDWPMKVGTEVFAVADGEVFDAGTKTIRCKSGMEEATFVRVQHEAPNGETFIVGYLHLSEARVETGAEVKRGQTVGLSGNSGCSSGPHLHLAVEHVTDRERMKGKKIDPYGWEASDPDPRYVEKGHRSAWLWLPGEAPMVYKSLALNRDAEGKGLVITRMVGMGWQDDRFPNNEWVELAVGEEHGKNAIRLEGARLQNRAGDSMTFPKGASVRKGQPVRIYTGEGAANAQTFFWGRGEGIWQDDADCAQVIGPDGEVKASHYWGRKKEALCAP